MTTFGQFPQAVDAGAAAAKAVHSAAPRCSFYVRTQVAADPLAYRYDALYVRGGAYGQSGHLVTPYPPAVGDTIFLVDDGGSGSRTGSYRVVDRSWAHSGYGSADWPRDAKWSRVGPLLTIIVEEAIGPFRDEADLPNEEN